ncbi:Protein of unknown function [Filimonas lacunae]|uniref:DUF2911 domain-containing protein n=1 Tax=Filimonas lacunae TaxID=477680 RepID=A0A173MKH3_9BACT|nr:DUF2911 domain-containing protein [Filimonas lacunae]BAV08145.1 hypothetical protein FLA_4178 [Filimonas lacunae]SIT09924.1 Protein of unknown function [Filimonas lacunae]
MKRVLGLLAVVCAISGSVFAQEQKKPASPLDSVSATIKSGAAVSIVYSRPSVKGRTIGKDLEPLPGKIWRAGANAATTFEVSKAVTVEGKALPAGKYAFFTIHNDKEWTLIFNKVSKTWGAYDYEKNKAEDALQVTVKDGKGTFTETLTYTISKSGEVSLLWGDHVVKFTIK